LIQILLQILDPVAAFGAFWIRVAGMKTPFTQHSNDWVSTGGFLIAMEGWLPVLNEQFGGKPSTSNSRRRLENKFYAVMSKPISMKTHR
jgi:hypothetical protein